MLENILMFPIYFGLWIKGVAVIVFMLSIMLMLFGFIFLGSITWLEKCYNTLNEKYRKVFKHENDDNESK